MTTGGDFDYKQFRKDWDNLLASQKYKEAEKLCHEGLAKSPLDQSRGRLYNHLGYLYENFLDDKTFDDILEHYVLSLQVDESNANSHYNLANFLLEQGMQHLLRALELNPNHNKANKRYANLTPIKANTTLDLSGHKYQVVEVVEDGVRAVKLQKRNDGGYERSDDEPVYVEVSSPEKVYPPSNKNRKGRTANINGNNQPIALNIDDPNGGYQQNGTYHNQNGCCFKCVFYWWFWFLLWFIALGGIVVPVLAYLKIFGTDECTHKITVNNMAINTDTSTQGKLDILFVMNCDSNNWDDQFTSADDMLSTLINNNQLSVQYQLAQYCNNMNASVSANFVDYTSTSTITAATSGLVAESPVDGNNNEIQGALEACKGVYNELYDDNDNTPFLCIPFVSFEFMDTFEAMSITSDSTFDDIYLTFMVDETDIAFPDNSINAKELYSVLGSFTVSTECIRKIDLEYAYGNTWWDTKLNCNSNSIEQSYCQHCIEYGSNTENVNCASTELAHIFSDVGITETQIEDDATEEVCTHKYDEIFVYCIAGIVPLLLWVFVVICVLCCRSCKNRNRSNMEQSHGLNNNDNKQTAFV